MYIVLERDSFIKLYKFGELNVALERLIKSSELSSSEKPAVIAMNVLNSKVPYFEQDHEILILKISIERILLKEELSTTILVKLSDVQKVFPISEEAARFLVGRFDPQIKIQRPIFEELFLELKKDRDWKLRVKGYEALKTIYKIDESLLHLVKEEIDKGVKDRINRIKIKDDDKYLAQVIRFNRNPVFPNGSINYFFKAGFIYVELKGGAEEDFEVASLNKELHREEEIKKLNLLDAIEVFKKRDYGKILLQYFESKYETLDVLSITTFFLHFKDTLNKNNNDLRSINQQIHVLIESKPKEAAIVLYMVSMLFSFENLYSSIYSISNIQLFNNPKPSVFEREKELINALKQIQTEKETLIVSNEHLKSVNEKLIAEMHDLNERLKKQSLTLRNQNQSLFDRIDMNKDGIISIEEVSVFCQELTNEKNISDTHSSNKESNIVGGKSNSSNISIEEIESNKEDDIEAEKSTVYPTEKVYDNASKNKTSLSPEHDNSESSYQQAKMDGLSKMRRLGNTLDKKNLKAWNFFIKKFEKKPSLDAKNIKSIFEEDEFRLKNGKLSKSSSEILKKIKDEFKEVN